LRYLNEDEGMATTQSLIHSNR